MEHFTTVYKICHINKWLQKEIKELPNRQEYSHCCDSILMLTSWNNAFLITIVFLLTVDMTTCTLMYLKLCMLLKLCILDYMCCILLKFDMTLCILVDLTVLHLCNYSTRWPMEWFSYVLSLGTTFYLHLLTQFVSPQCKIEVKNQNMTCYDYRVK